MRAAFALTALALAPALVACGTGGGDTAAADATLPPVTTATAPTPAGAPAVPDQTRLRAALLGVGDLPAGFASIPDPEQDLGLPATTESAQPDRASTDPKACAAVLAELADQVPGATARGVARFTGPAFTSIDTDAAAYPDAGAAFAFTTVQRTLAACDRYTGTDADGVAVQYRLGGLDQPTVGDASVAVRLQTTSDGVTMVSDAVIAVTGGVIVQVVASGQQPIDPAVLAGLARTAVEKQRHTAD
ncbi:hypothetical protein GCM10023094_26910 [Rhodococcus olei]|uniref:PknH-like protein n=1 Tax=Rhodococcus olei TaxID=2161675 RepID=A0ABP8P557_9NOCA